MDYPVSQSDRSVVSNLELVEEFPKNPEHTLFEKILVAARRAKDLHDEDKAQLVLTHHTAPYIALQELREGKITPTYREELPEEQIEEETEEGDEEE